MKGAFKVIPAFIHAIINDSTGSAFDSRYFQHLNAGIDKKEAFYTTLDEVREYFPLYTRRTTYESYAHLLKAKYGSKMRHIVVPTRIADMAGSFNGFTKEFFIQLDRGGNRHQVFNQMMTDIRSHFPNYKGLTTYECFQVSLSKTKKKGYKGKEI